MQLQCESGTRPNRQDRVAGVEIKQSNPDEAEVKEKKCRASFNLAAMATVVVVRQYANDLVVAARHNASHLVAVEQHGHGPRRRIAASQSAWGRRRCRR